MPDTDNQRSARLTVLDWAKAVALVAVIVLVVGPDRLLRFAKAYGEFLVAILGGCAVFAAVLGSVMSVYEWTDKRYGESAARGALVAFVIVGLPLVARILQIAIDYMRSL